MRCFQNLRFHCNYIEFNSFICNQKIFLNATAFEKNTLVNQLHLKQQNTIATEYQLFVSY